MKACAWLLLALAACAVSWTYMHRVLLPWEHYVNVEHGQWKEQMGDLYPRWVGTRELLLNRRNPYSAEVSHEIQIGFYGHPVEQSYNKPASEILDEQRFAYPVYVVFLLAPTIHLEFAALQAWMPVLLGFLTAGSVLLWISVLRWRPPPWIVIAIVMLVLSSAQLAQGMRLRQLGLLAAFLVALATWCVVRQRLLLGGILLALATIKPQFVVLCLVWFLLWSVGDWKSRWRLVAGFAASLGVLAGVGDILVPGWVRYFLAGMEAYQRYFPLGTQSVLRVILGNWIGGVLSLVAVVALLGYAWRRRRVRADSGEFLQIVSWFFVTATLVLPLLTPYNQVLLLLPILILIREWVRLPRWERLGFALFLAWPLVAMVVMLVLPPQLDSMRRTPLLPSAALPLFPFLVGWLTFTRSQQEARGMPVGVPI